VTVVGPLHNGCVGQYPLSDIYFIHRCSPIYLVVAFLEKAA